MYIFYVVKSHVVYIYVERGFHPTISSRLFAICDQTLTRDDSHQENLINFHYIQPFTENGPTKILLAYVSILKLIVNGWFFLYKYEADKPHFLL